MCVYLKLNFLKNEEYYAKIVLYTILFSWIESCLVVHFWLVYNLNKFKYTRLKNKEILFFLIF